MKLVTLTFATERARHPWSLVHVSYVCCTHTRPSLEGWTCNHFKPPHPPPPSVNCLPACLYDMYSMNS